MVAWQIEATGRCEKGTAPQRTVFHDRWMRRPLDDANSVELRFEMILEGIAKRLSPTVS